jgi:hypothetical protein
MGEKLEEPVFRYCKYNRSSQPRGNLPLHLASQWYDVHHRGEARKTRVYVPENHPASPVIFT